MSVDFINGKRKTHLVQYVVQERHDNDPNRNWRDSFSYAYEERDKAIIFIGDGKKFKNFEFRLILRETDIYETMVNLDD